MDSKLLLSYPGPSSLPSPLYHTFPCHARRPVHRTFQVSFPARAVDRTQFLGERLLLRQQTPDLKMTQFRFLPVGLAAVKRRKEMPFDNVIQRDKKLKLVMKIRKILMSQPDRVMSLRELGRYRRDLGLTRNRRFIALLKRFPAVFEIVEEGVFSLKFKLTPEAEQIYFEELRIRNEMEDFLVVKLRKLLMMSLEKRILLEKIAHLKNDLSLPLEFKDTICERYPQYFKVVRTDRGPALELTHWDPELAISVAEMEEEEKREREKEENNLIIDRPPKFKRVKLPRGLTLSKGEMRRISMFRDMPYISPYSDFSHLRPGTPEKEKHACAVVHELLSLTVEKRTLVDHLTHFREEFRFSQQVRGMLIRHPDMFYVSLKGDRDSVFLREAYRDSQLIEKDKLLILKEKMRALVAVPRFGRRGPRKTEENGTESDDRGDDEDDEWSDDINGLEQDGLSDAFDDDDADNDDDDGDDDDDVEDDDDEDDDWSDEDDDDGMPPVFDDDDRSSSFQQRPPSKSTTAPSISEEKVPVLPDGRPRQRW